MRLTVAADRRRIRDSDADSGLAQHRPNRRQPAVEVAVENLAPERAGRPLPAWNCSRRLIKAQAGAPWPWHSAIVRATAPDRLRAVRITRHRRMA
jgi:hypothetical protein